MPKDAVIVGHIRQLRDLMRAWKSRGYRLVIAMSCAGLIASFALGASVLLVPDNTLTRIDMPDVIARDLAAPDSKHADVAVRKFFSLSDRIAATNDSALSFLPLILLVVVGAFVVRFIVHSVMGDSEISGFVGPALGVALLMSGATWCIFALSDDATPEPDGQSVSALLAQPTYEHKQEALYVLAQEDLRSASEQDRVGKLAAISAAADNLQLSPAYARDPKTAYVIERAAYGEPKSAQAVLYYREASKHSAMARNVWYVGGITCASLFALAFACFGLAWSIGRRLRRVVQLSSSSLNVQKPT